MGVSLSAGQPLGSDSDPEHTCGTGVSVSYRPTWWIAQSNQVSNGGGGLLQLIMYRIAFEYVLYLKWWFIKPSAIDCDTKV